MNTWKRFVSGLLALCMVLCMAPTSVGATGGAVVRASDAEAYAGCYAYVYINAENLESLASADVEIYYDSDAMRVHYTSAGGLLSGSFSSVNTNTVGVIKLSAAWTAGISGSGQLLTVCFKINSDCTPGNYPVRVAVGEAYDASLNTVSMSGVSGSVTAKKSAASSKTFSIWSSADTVTLSRGETTTLILNGNSSYAFASADFTVEYDSELFRVTDVRLHSNLTVEDAVYSVNTSILGTVRISYASVTSISTYNLLEVDLEAVADTDAYSSVTFTASDVYDIDRNPYKTGSCSIGLSIVNCRR